MRPAGLGVQLPRRTSLFFGKDQPVMCANLAASLDTAPTAAPSLGTAPSAATGKKRKLEPEPEPAAAAAAAPEPVDPPMSLLPPPKRSRVCEVMVHPDGTVRIIYRGVSPQPVIKIEDAGGAQ